MKAARLEDGALQIADVPAPTPGAEEALIRISAAGVCHSDLHMVKAHFTTGRSSGLGHEGIETTQIYVHADLSLKERALARTTPIGSEPGRLPTSRHAARLPGRPVIMQTSAARGPPPQGRPRPDIHIIRGSA